jgi:hypothetical protein
VSAGVLRTGDRSVRLSLCSSFDLQNANDAAAQDDARESRCIVDHYDVEGIAVIRSRRGYEAKVMGISQSGKKRFRENEGFEFRVVFKFDSAPAGRCHDDMHIAIFCKRRQVDEVRYGECSKEVEGGAAPKSAKLRP